MAGTFAYPYAPTVDSDSSGALDSKGIVGKRVSGCQGGVGINKFGSSARIDSDSEGIGALGRFSCEDYGTRVV